MLRAGKRIINHCSEHLHLIVFTTLHGFCFHLLFSRTPRRNSSYLYLHFIAKETKAKEVNTLLKATMLVKRSQFQSQVPWLQDMGFIFPHSPSTTRYVNGMSRCSELIQSPAQGLGQVPAVSACCRPALMSRSGAHAHLLGLQRSVLDLGTAALTTGLCCSRELLPLCPAF